MRLVFMGRVHLSDKSYVHLSDNSSMHLSDKSMHFPTHAFVRLESYYAFTGMYGIIYVLYHYHIYTHILLNSTYFLQHIIHNCSQWNIQEASTRINVEMFIQLRTVTNTHCQKNVSHLLTSNAFYFGKNAKAQLS